MTPEPKYIFADRTLFFPKEGILTIGDLHIGYEESLIDAGVLIPEQQVKETILILTSIIDAIKSKGHIIKKVIFLGDIKHMFGYEWKEKKNFNTILNFLKEHVSEENILVIKGNHDTMSLGPESKECHIEGDVAFLHGHESYPEIYDKKIKIVVSGHLHPSVILSENPGVKSEGYKCFLEGKSQGKIFIVVPSFLDFYQLTPINNYKEDFIEFFSIIPRKDILKFKVHVVGNDGIYDFGTVNDLN